jgi:DNA-binding transcriptional LysR family regulator
MNLRSVDLNLLTVFDAIMAERNITLASEKINMSQPAMSAALARLRIMLKDDLFVRTGRGVKPTSRALELEAPVRQILDKIVGTLSQSMGFDSRTSERAFNLASVDYGGIVVVPKLVKHLQELESSVRVNVLPQYDTDLKDLMHFGHVDFALDDIPIVENDIQVELVTRETAYCLVRKGHPTIKAAPTMEQFLEAEHVSIFPRGDRVSSLDSYLLSINTPRKHGMRVASYFNSPYVVMETDMIAAMPEKVALHMGEVFDLNVFPGPFDDWLAPVYLMWHSSFNDDPGHKWMREIIFALFGDS